MACGARRQTTLTPSEHFETLPPPQCPPTPAQIIALANLRDKATRSSQTAASAFRAEGGSQTWAPRAASCQTPMYKGQSMPRRLRYVSGLRGAPRAARMAVVDVALDLGQPHQF